MPGRVRFLLFDLDGTLISPGTDFRAMREDVKAMLVGEGVPADFPFRHILGGLEDACTWLRAQGRGDDGVARMRERCYAAIEARERAGLASARPIPGVAEALDAWRARFKLGIFTRTHPEVLRASVERFRLGSFEVLLSRADGPAKPDPRQVVLALERAGVRAEEALAIGDHVFDMESARGAGVRSVGVLTGSGKRDELLHAGASKVVGSVPALRADLG